MKNFSGKVLFLDRSDINTDEIIPAKYLTENSKEALKPHCLEDLKLAGFSAKTDLADKRVVVSRANFGCGSSREHAVWAFEVNGITVVIAENFARIFRTNMFNCGLLAIELPKVALNKLFSFKGKETTISVNFKARSLTAKAGTRSETFSFVLAEWDASLVQADGWVGYAEKNY